MDNTNIKSEPFTKNARITSIKWQPQGGLCCSVGLDFGVFHKGLVRYSLAFDDRAYKFISQLIAVTQTSDWNNFVGKYVRAKFENDDFYNGEVEAIGHLTKDIWLEPAKWHNFDKFED